MARSYLVTVTTAVSAPREGWEQNARSDEAAAIATARIAEARRVSTGRLQEVDGPQPRGSGTRRRRAIPVPNRRRPGDAGDRISAVAAIELPDRSSPDLPGRHRLASGTRTIRRFRFEGRRPVAASKPGSIRRTLLKRIMLGGTISVNHDESGRHRFPPRPGRPDPPPPPGARADAGPARRAVRVASHVHRLGGARRAEPVDPQPEADRPGPARPPRDPVLRGRRLRGLTCKAKIGPDDDSIDPANPQKSNVRRISYAISSRSMPSRPSRPPSGLWTDRPPPPPAKVP